MKIKMNVQFSGTRNGQPWPGRGGTVDLPDPEASKLCAAGLASPVAEDRPVETATVPADDVETRDASPQAEAPARPAQRRTRSK